MKKYALLLLMSLVAQLGATELMPIATADSGFQRVASVSWLQSRGATYLAVGGQQVDNTQLVGKVAIYNLEDDTLNIVTSIDFGTIADNVAWLQSRGIDYLAVGGDDKVAVYRFDASNPEGQKLEELTSITVASGVVWNVAWLQSRGMEYLAVGGTGNMVLLYNFANGSLAEAASTQFDASVTGLSWLQSRGVDYLAVSGHLGQVVVHKLEQGVLEKFAEAPVDTGVRSIAWLQSRGIVYLTAGKQDKIVMYTFDASKAAGQRIEQAASVPFDGMTIALDWLQSRGMEYLAAGQSQSNNGLVAVYNPEDDVLLNVASADFGNIAWTVAWTQSRGMDYLAAGGVNNPNEIVVYSLVN